ncbi:MAG TPA: hypothetical protein VGT44_14190 [Ktedonobacteraceae bacterium]|nr:hypothetical protein [Ktedonobacteraceae bacterium]
MAGRSYRRSTPAENFRVVIGAIPWRLLILVPMLLVIAFPFFLYGTTAGQRMVPALTNYFYHLSDAPTPVATPYPTFPTNLPQIGALLYSVQAGDNCDEILTNQMHMVDAGQIFSDVTPGTVKALDNAIGQDCHALQPGMVIALYPHYPLVAIGGVIFAINPLSPQQPLPTPLINVQQQVGIDCSGGCDLSVRIAAHTAVQLLVQTTLQVRVGSWVWAQAMLPRKQVAGFAAYPYADPAALINGMSLRACDFQVNATHDDNSLSCSQLTPNTILDDNGAWLYSVTGPGSLDHWRYALARFHFPGGTRVLLWLSLDNNGNLVYRQGNPAYRYDNATHVYVPA